MSEELEKAGIKSVPIGKSFVGFCVLRNKELRYKQSGEPYLILELGDRSGRLKARIWEKPLEYEQAYQAGNIIKIKAVVQAFQDKKELKIQKIRLATAEDEVELKDLLPASPKDLQQLKQKLHEHINSIENPYLKKLLSGLFDVKEFEEAFYLSPAGKLWHHNYLSGLIEHVVTMLDIGQLLKTHYPLLDLELLKCGIICHNIGKVKEYSLDGFIDFSDQGRLIGYNAMGFEMASRQIAVIEGFPAELRDRLVHLILSHQNESRENDGVVPMTLEAVVLRCLILLDANTNALCRIQENDALPGSKWTKYIPLLDRFIYVGGKLQEKKGRDN